MIEFRDFGTSFNSWTSRTWVYMANHVEEKMVKSMWRPQKFTSVEEMSTPFPT